MSEGELPFMTDNEGQMRGVPPRLFRAAVEQSPVAISITDLHANILYTNPAFHRVTGYKPSDVAGCNESILSDKRTPPQVYRTMWQSLMEQLSWSGVLINRRKDGTPYLAELSVAPVLDETGIATHYLGIHRDVTGIHRLQSRLANHHQLIESVINAAPVVIALIDEKGEIVMRNPAYLQLAKELQEIEPADLILGTASDAGKVFGDREIRIDRPGGLPPRWFVCTATRVHEQGEGADSFFARQRHEYLLLIAKEITELKRQQEQMRINSLQSLVSEQEKIGTLRETIAAALFQLQGPFNMLTAAMGMESRRSERGEHSTPLFNALHAVVAAGNEAISVLEGSLPKLAYEPLVPLNINQVIRDALSITTERLLSEGIVIDWRPSPVLPAIWGHENQLRAMFKQLIDNAIDVLGGHYPQDRSLMITSETCNGELRITIEDSGPGIPEENLLKVFEPFFTTRTGSDHTGMGLVMAQEIVNRHSGVLRLANRDEGGCRVLICLPIHAPQRCEEYIQESL